MSGRFPGAQRRLTDSVKEWGAEGSHRVAMWLNIMKVRYGTKGLVAMCNAAVKMKAIDNLLGGTDPSPRLVRAVVAGLAAHGVVVDLNAIARGGTA